MAGISPSTYTGPYTANGSQTAFPFDFTANSSSEVAVEVDGVTVSPALYSVALASDYNSGTVTFLTAPANAALVKLYANPDFTQSSEFENEGAYKLSTVNTINRRSAVRDLWLRAQALLLSPPGFATAANRAGKFLGWGGGGDPVLLSGTGADSSLRTDLAASGGSALAGFIQSGTGATARSAQTKLRDTVSVKDFGAVGNGTTDDTAAFQAAITAAITAKHPLFMPNGIYKVSSPLTGTIPAQADDTNNAFSIYGEGAASTGIYYTGAAGDDVLFLTGTAPGLDSIRMGGFRIFRDDAITSGAGATGAALRLKNLTDLQLFDFLSFGNGYAVHGEGLINCFLDVASRFDRRGILLEQGTGLSACNANTIHPLILSAYEAAIENYGGVALLIQGGSIEGTGQGNAGTPRAIYNYQSGADGMLALKIDGTYFENNKGPQVHIVPTAYSTIYRIEALFNRTSASGTTYGVYYDASALAGSSVEQTLDVSGSGFNRVSGSASSATPFVGIKNADGIGGFYTGLNFVDLGTIYSNTTELPAGVGTGSTIAKVKQIRGNSALLVNAANDGAAATAGVPVGGEYRNGSIRMTRIA